MMTDKKDIMHYLDEVTAIVKLIAEYDPDVRVKLLSFANEIIQKVHDLRDEHSKSVLTNE